MKWLNVKNEGTVTAINFAPIFFKLDIYKPWLNTRFKFKFQHSSLKLTFLNGRLNYDFFSKMAAKTGIAKNENKTSRRIDFDPLITNMCMFCAF